MTDRTFKIAGLGEALWDVHGDEYLFGGAPANVACHCCSLGAHAYIVSCIGDDELGRKAEAFLSGHGVDTSCLHVSSEHETGVVMISLDDRGIPEYDIRQDVAWDNIPFTAQMKALAPQLDAVCFGSLAQRHSLSRQTITSFLKATSADCLKLFDVNVRLDFYTEELIEESLTVANALKVNDEELPLLAKIAGTDSGDQNEQLAGVLKAFDLKLAILTCGPKGAVMMTPETDCFAWAPDPAPIINTVGAGDSFTATAIVGFLNGDPLATVNQRANSVAAYVCTQNGAVPPLPENVLNG